MPHSTHGTKCDHRTLICPSFLVMSGRPRRFNFLRIYMGEMGQKLRNGQSNTMGQAKYWNAIKDGPGFNCISDWSTDWILKRTNAVSGGHLVSAMRFWGSSCQDWTLTRAPSLVCRGESLLWQWKQKRVLNFATALNVPSLFLPFEHPCCQLSLPLFFVFDSCRKEKSFLFLRHRLLLYRWLSETVMTSCSVSQQKRPLVMNKTKHNFWLWFQNLVVPLVKCSLSLQSNSYCRVISGQAGGGREGKLKPYCPAAERRPRGPWSFPPAANPIDRRTGLEINGNAFPCPASPCCAPDKQLKVNTVMTISKG